MENDTFQMFNWMASMLEEASACEVSITFTQVALDSKCNLEIFYPGSDPKQNNTLLASSAETRVTENTSEKVLTPSFIHQRLT